MIIDYDGGELTLEDYEKIDIPEEIKVKPFDERFSCSCGFKVGYKHRTERCDICRTCCRYGGLEVFTKDKVSNLSDLFNGKDLKPKDFREFIGYNSKQQD